MPYQWRGGSMREREKSARWVVAGRPAARDESSESVSDTPASVRHTQRGRTRQRLFLWRGTSEVGSSTRLKPFYHQPTLGKRPVWCVCVALLLRARVSCLCAKVSVLPCLPPSLLICLLSLPPGTRVLASTQPHCLHTFSIAGYQSLDSLGNIF